MILVINIHGWHDRDEICTVNYGLGKATLAKVHYAYIGPDSAPIHTIKGTHVSVIEDQLTEMGFEKLDVGGP